MLLFRGLNLADRIFTLFGCFWMKTKLNKTTNDWLDSSHDDDQLLNGFLWQSLDIFCISVLFLCVCLWLQLQLQFTLEKANTNSKTIQHRTKEPP